MQGTVLTRSPASSRRSWVWDRREGGGALSVLVLLASSQQETRDRDSGHRTQAAPHSPTGGSETPPIPQAAPASVTELPVPGAWPGGRGRWWEVGCGAGQWGAEVGGGGAGCGEPAVGSGKWGAAQPWPPLCVASGS